MRSLLTGTVGNNPEGLMRRRTEPLVVTLNVAELLADLDLHPGLLTVAEALAVCEERHASDNPKSLVVEQELAEIEKRYAREFAAYAEHFTKAVTAAAHLVPGLPIPVVVHFDADPWSCWWSKDATVNLLPCDDDAVAVDLWQAAHAVVRLPDIDIQISAPATECSIGDQGSKEAR